MSFNFKQYTANNPLLREDGDNVTAADNAAYGADQEAGEPFEEEVTVSSSGVEMEGINEDIDIWQMAGDHLENFRSELASAHAMASQSGQREWVSALNKIALRLDALELTRWAPLSLSLFLGKSVG